MSAEASQQLTNPEILLGILSTLQRLEAHFANQDESPATKLPMEYCKEAEYQSCVNQLRNRFEFDSRIDLEPCDQAPPREDTQDSVYSMSVYSSRPLSRFELDTMLAPQPLNIIPVEMYEPIYHPETDVESCASGLPGRYSLSGSSAAESKSSSQHSAESTATTMTTPTSIGSKHSLEPLELPARAYHGLKTTWKRSLSLRSKLARQPEAERRSIESIVEVAEPSNDSAQVPRAWTMVKTKAEGLSIMTTKFITHAGRLMMEQQLKKLDN
ncbi:uncharacterized protein E0L32_002437 [Thyridium curvatum]|uniref:Uncharacterized protein n=1 Tax=Thyridium curvatum TaxID=1093900 RepID=A0A507BP93_9PEZI|nr:uncharacterized protein E0L32_002437 [Thyridium curvatum]TPX18580.1 hypothetical protein E0L32_002437 [Thyridium curvatum]